MSDEIQEKLEELENRIQNARVTSELHGNLEKQEQNTKSNAPDLKSGRAGSEFLANIIAGWVLGLGLDYFLGTKPWLMLGFMILGFVSGVYRANKAMQKNGK